MAPCLHCASQAGQSGQIETRSGFKHLPPRASHHYTRRPEGRRGPAHLPASLFTVLDTRSGIRSKLLRTASSLPDHQPQSREPESAETLLQLLQPYGVEEGSPVQLGWTLTDSGENIRGVVATGNHEAGSTILSVPVPLVLTDIGHDKSGDVPWSGFMAVKLLQKYKGCCSNDRGGAEDLTCTWLESLPKEVQSSL